MVVDIYAGQPRAGNESHRWYDIEKRIPKARARTYYAVQ